MSFLVCFTTKVHQQAQQSKGQETGVGEQHLLVTAVCTYWPRLERLQERIVQILLLALRGSFYFIFNPFRCVINPQPSFHELQNRNYPKQKRLLSIKEKRLSPVKLSQSQNSKQNYILPLLLHCPKISMEEGTKCSQITDRILSHSSRRTQLDFQGQWKSGREKPSQCCIKNL